jgi:hypothetical protein
MQPNDRYYYSGHDEGDKGRKVKSYDSGGKPVFK